MKEVSIYIVSSIRGRWDKTGYIGYVLEFHREGSKYPVTLKNIEKVEQMNENRSELEALIRAMSRMREKCILYIYTDSEYIYNGFAGKEFVTQWIKNEWKTVRGTEVKNKDKWQELISALQGNMYRFLLKERNAYTGTLQEEVNRREKISNV